MNGGELPSDAEELQPSACCWPRRQGVFLTGTGIHPINDYRITS